MRITDLNWMQVEALLAREDRAVLPVGSIEQHAHLSLATDTLLAERLAVEAAEPLGVPVFPAIAYGVTPGFRAYPGTVSLRMDTLVAVLTDALDSLAAAGFRRVLIHTSSRAARGRRSRPTVDRGRGRPGLTRAGRVRVGGQGGGPSENERAREPSRARGGASACRVLPIAVER